MALAESNMLPLGTVAPSFNLPNVVTGQNLSLADLPEHKALVVMFICNHCPFVIHVLPEILRLSMDYDKNEVAFVAISSNDVVNYPDDSPDKMKKLAKDLPMNFPYLYDEDQECAKAYDAACTPDFYVFDKDNKLTYRGRLDESRPGNDKPLDGKDLRSAINKTMRGESIESQYPSAGCNIKWLN